MLRWQVPSQLLSPLIPFGLCIKMLSAFLFLFFFVLNAGNFPWAALLLEINYVSAFDGDVSAEA